MAARKIRTAELQDAAGKVWIAWQFQHVIVSQQMDGRSETGGATYWQLPNRHPLNTDDDIEFEDLNGISYTIVQ